MAIQRTQILRGPGTVKFDNVSFFDAGGITAETESATSEIPSSISGTIDTIKTDQSGKIAFTPVGEISAAILAKLFPYTNPTIGASVFGSADRPLEIHSLAGTKVTFVNAALTKMPEIYLSPVKTAFGSAEFTALLGLGMAPGDASSFYTTGAQVYNLGMPDPDGFTGAQFSATFGSLTIADTVDGWTVTPALELQPVTTDSLGTIDYTVSGLTVTARCQPLGLTEAQILGALPTTATRGASLRGSDDLVISGGSGKLAVTLKNATLVRGPLEYGNTALRAGEIEFTAHRSFNQGAMGPVWDIGIAD